MGIFVLFFDASDLLMYGYLLGADDEESPLCRGEKLRFEQAPLSVALYCSGSVPILPVAWQHLLTP